MTPSERSSFLLWCRQQGTQVVAEMAKSVKLEKQKKAAALRLPITMTSTWKMYLRLELCQ